MTTRPIHIGVLGAARIAPEGVIEPAKRRNDAVIVAVAAREIGRAKAFALRHEIPLVAENYEALVAREDVDLVYNALPPVRHGDLSIAALEAGKAVLCEKPFAMNAGEARRMVDAAARAQRLLVEAFHYRFHPAFERFLVILSSGEIGRVRRVEAAFCASIPYRAGELRHEPAVGGGSLMDLGCYPLHWVRMAMGAEPTVIAARAIVERDNIDAAMEADLDFGEGRSALIRCSMIEPVRQAFIRVEGELGTVEFENPIAPYRGHRIVTRVGAMERREAIAGLTTYDCQLQHVIDVLAGRAQSITGGADAVANMTAIDAIYRAAGMLPRGL
jgi:predicted dehydrogenase